MKISTSVLTETEYIKDVVEKLNQTTTDYLHLDVMDGKFVSNNTIHQMDEVLKNNTLPLDIHLMVEDVENFVLKYETYHPTYITFHIENREDTMPLITMIKERGIKVGLAFNPGTDMSLILPYLPYLDLVLVMSVPAGYGGQAFVPTTSDIIEQLLMLRKQKNYLYLIEVDGGINEQTISKVQKADIVVSGSYIMNGNYEERIETLRRG